MNTRLHNKHKEGTLIKHAVRAEESLCENVFSKETTFALEKLGEILKNIHKRMTYEGFEIVDGSIHKTTSKNINVHEKYHSQN